MVGRKMKKSKKNVTLQDCTVMYICNPSRLYCVEITGRAQMSTP